MYTRVGCIHNGMVQSKQGHNCGCACARARVCVDVVDVCGDGLPVYVGVCSCRRRQEGGFLEA